MWEGDLSSPPQARLFAHFPRPGFTLKIVSSCAMSVSARKSGFAVRSSPMMQPTLGEEEGKGVGGSGEGGGRGEGGAPPCGGGGGGA